MNKADSQPIHFHYLYKKFTFRNRNAVKKFIVQQLKKENKTVEVISYIFCSDKYLLKLNQQYLDHDTYTDIITFENSLKGFDIIADIYISIERIKENGTLYSASFQEELLRVIFHGALHLAGYKDKTPHQINLMRLKENEWLNQFNVSREMNTMKD